jgi:hypothetical protein
MEQLFDPTKPHFSAWVWIYDIDHRFRESMFEARPTPLEAVPLYYATLCGFRDLHQQNYKKLAGFWALLACRQAHKAKQVTKYRKVDKWSFKVPRNVSQYLIY